MHTLNEYCFGSTRSVLCGCHRQTVESVVFPTQPAWAAHALVSVAAISRQRLVLVVCLLVFACSSQAAEKPNVLFIAIDDLRPELGCYGSEIAITPNLDALAKDGLLFNRAYCQQAICSPSRASLMTGARPDTIGITENYAYFRDLNSDIVTLPQHFIANG